MAADSLASTIRAARTTLGLTQAELAAAASRSKAWIVDLERGRSLPADFPTVVALSRALGLDPADLWATSAMERATKGATVPSEMMTLVGESLLSSVEPDPELAAVRVEPRSERAVVQVAENLAGTLFESAVAEGFAMPIAAALEEAPATGQTASLAHPLRADAGLDVSFEGAAAFEEESGSFVITLRHDVWERARAGHGRARFTAAHELGHVVLHGSELTADQGHMFRDAVTAAARRQRGGIPAFMDAEWQANVFASALLMPEAAVRSHLKKRLAVGNGCSLEDIAQNFQVSLQAAGIRIGKLLPRLVGDAIG